MLICDNPIIIVLVLVFLQHVWCYVGATDSNNSEIYKTMLPWSKTNLKKMRGIESLRNNNLWIKYMFKNALAITDQIMSNKFHINY